MKNMDHARAIAAIAIERFAVMEARRIMKQIHSMDRYDLIDLDKAEALVNAFNEKSGAFQAAELNAVTDETVTRFKAR